MTNSEARSEQLYHYIPDANNFAGITLSDSDHDQVLSVHDIDSPLAAEWIAPDSKGFEDNPPTDGDFPGLSDYNEIPIMSQRAWEVFRPLIGDCCEALPIGHPSGKPFYIIHVMKTIDALDEKRSELSRSRISGRVSRTYKYAFKPGLLIGQHIFKLPLMSGAELLVDDEFRRVVEDNNLEGLLLKPLPMVD